MYSQGCGGSSPLIRTKEIDRLNAARDEGGFFVSGRNGRNEALTVFDTLRKRGDIMSKSRPNAQSIQCEVMPERLRFLKGARRIEESPVTELRKEIASGSAQ